MLFCLYPHCCSFSSSDVDFCISSSPNISTNTAEKMQLGKECIRILYEIPYPSTKCVKFFLTIQFECFPTWVAMVSESAEGCHQLLPRAWGCHGCGDRSTNISEKPLPPTDRTLVPTYRKTTVSMWPRTITERTRLLEQCDPPMRTSVDTSSCVHFLWHDYWRVRKIAKTDLQVRHVFVCPSAWNNSAPIGLIIIRIH